MRIAYDGNLLHPEILRRFLPNITHSPEGKRLLHFNALGLAVIAAIATATFSLFAYDVSFVIPWRWLRIVVLLSYFAIPFLVFTGFDFLIHHEIRKDFLDKRIRDLALTATPPHQIIGYYFIPMMYARCVYLFLIFLFFAAMGEQEEIFLATGGIIGFFSIFSLIVFIKRLMDGPARSVIFCDIICSYQSTLKPWRLFQYVLLTNIFIFSIFGLIISAGLLDDSFSLINAGITLLFITTLLGSNYLKYKVPYNRLRKEFTTFDELFKSRLEEWN